MPRIFTPLGAGHDRAAFSCGQQSLDDYLKRRAGQDIRRYLAACHVLIDADNPAQIIGYYTLSSAGVVLTDLPLDLQKKVGRYPMIPALLLGRLAVDSCFQGEGIGDVLLGDALRRTLRLNREVGTMMIVVDAVDERVVGFYERREFKRLQDQSLRLYLPMAKIAGMFPEEGPGTSSGEGP